MKILFIGGTGNISTACSRRVLARGDELFLMTRGARELPADLRGANCLICDVHDLASAQAALGDRTFDVVVDFIAFEPQDIERDVALFSSRCAQFVFISSASAYQKPPSSPHITESTPLANPFWAYSRAKIACEERLMQLYREQGFPVTIVRPSYTYDTVLPVAVARWDYTVVERMRRGAEIVVHGDGTSLWTVTHSDDFAVGFVGLLGHPAAVGHAFHITSDEVLTWNQIYETIAQAAGVTAKLVHIPSSFIARCDPERGAGLLGDKTYSAIFDNSKIKRFVPEFRPAIPFHLGIRRTLAWFEARAERMRVDEQAHVEVDRILEAYRTVFAHL